jgi:hypothetical protein
MGMGVGGRMRRAVRRVQNPVVTLTLAVLLVLDLATLPGDPPHSTRVGHVVQGAILQNALRTYDPLQIQVFVILSEGRPTRVIDPDRESWDELGAIVDSRPQDVVMANYVVHQGLLSGFYAPTRRESQALLQLVGTSESDLGSHVDRGEVRDFVVSYFLSRPDLAGFGRRVEGGDVIERRILWLGVAHDVASGVALVLLALSVAWIQRAPAWVREQRAARALARGRCPSCGYAIAGLDTCPECGRAIDSTQPSPATSV